ncbi:MAG: tyrosine-type recombinase/integrase [Acetobacteraceae bacterium]
MPAWGHHVQRRGGIYHLRVRIPGDLRARLDRREVRKSLQTRCPLEAKAKAAVAYARVQHALAEIRLSVEEDQAAIIAVLQAALNEAEEVIDLQQRVGEKKASAAERKALTAALEVMEAQRRVLERQREALAKLGIAAEDISDWAERVRDGGVVAQAHEATAALEAMFQRAGLATKLTQSPRVLEFFEADYIKEKSLQEDGRKHMMNYIRLFARITGNLRLNEYTRKDVVEYVRTLERLKWTLGKDPRDNTLTIEALVRQSEGKRCFGATTVEKHLTHVRGLMLTALGYHRYSSEVDVKKVFAPVPLSKFVPPPQTRSIWQIEQLNRLFASPIWSGTGSGPCDFPQRHVAGPHIYRDAYWWLPIIALYTGARLEELAQLHHADLKRDKNGIPYLDINKEGVRRLKNVGSVRVIPLHSALIEFGVLELFKPGTKGLVFPHLKRHGIKKALGGRYTIHWTRYRRSIEIYEEMLDFHSFRHTFITRLGEVEAPGLKIARIVGHVQADPDERRMRQTRKYSHFDVGPLKDAVERLSYPGLDLSPFTRAGKQA